MNFDELKDALTIAKETKKEGEKLGQFGIGMKSACSNLGKIFVVTTRKPNTASKLTAEYDEQQWLSDKSKKWTNFEIKEEDENKDWHGTRVAIGNLRVPLYPNQISNFKRSFGIRYGPYIKNKQIRIKINTTECVPVEPEPKKGTKQKISIKLPSGNQINGWIGLLEKRSIKGDYGVHIYKKGRLIKAFAKFGIRHHPEVAKIIGEIHLDHIPVNFHKTGFLEDSLEYNEAVSGFKNDPAVVKTLRSSTSKTDISEIKSVFDHDLKTNLEKPLDTRMSASNAKSLLRKASNFTVHKGNLNLDLEFQDTDKGVYQINHSHDKIKITVNRSSSVFGIFKNPLFLLGLIRIESELINENPKYVNFINDRNKKWNEFVTKYSPKPEIKKNRTEEKIVPIPNYSLDSSLLDLHGYLKEGFEHDFQFTGLSTLSPFLHNAYSKIIYNIQTITGAGQELLEAVSDFTEKTTVLLDPNPIQTETALQISKDNRFIIIREYAERLSTTWAIPEKAWLDLYVEVNTHKITMYNDELIMILDDLLGNRLVNTKKLRSLARHRKLSSQIETYIGDQ